MKEKFLTISVQSMGVHRGKTAVTGKNSHKTKNF